MESQVKMFSPLTDEPPVELGIKEQNFDEILEIGDMLATFNHNLIVYVQGPALQEWKEKA